MSILGIIGGLIASQGLIQGMLYTYPPYITGLARKTYPSLPNVLPPVADLVAMRYKELITEKSYADSAQEMGLDGDWSENLYKSANRLLDGREYVTLWRRGKIDERQLKDNLAQLHYDTGDIERLKEVTEFYPSPIDLVRFAVREVYKTSQVEKYGMAQDDDPEYYEAAKKAGLPKVIAEDFWKAHWELPSVGQGFEMLHRNAIKPGELDELLRAQDVMPFWREPLKKIAYRPYTRVDVRRMHANGTLNDDDLQQAYQDLGYDPEKAGKMKEFTIKYNSHETTGLSRASLVKAYKSGILSESDLAVFFYLRSLVYFPHCKAY